MKEKQLPKKAVAKKANPPKRVVKLLPTEKPLHIYVLLGIAFALYFNSLFNQYAFDDYTYIVESSYVQEGFKGIGKLLNSDALESYIKGKGGAMNELSGGRYRPLSLVTFAIEQQFFKDNFFIAHFINVALYVLTILLLFRFFNRRIFAGFEAGELMSFISTLIFAIHPLHTEVVANIKSRDEIMSLLFIVISLEYYFRYRDSNKIKEKIISWSFFFLALLSKEYAILLVVFVPILNYVLNKKTGRESFAASLPFLLIALFYVVMRVNIVGAHTTDSPTITNNPYLLATGTQKIATKIVALLYYIKLLFYPWPLSCDYSYDTFPFRTFGDPLVYLSILFYGGLIVLAFYWLKKRHILAIGLWFFLLPFGLVSNFAIDIGATIGERLMYHSSVGFAMILGYGFVFLLNKQKVKENMKQVAVFATGGVLTVLCALIIIPRNKIWENSVTLFTNDVKTVPRSLLMGNNAALKLVDQTTDAKTPAEKDSLYRLAITYLNRAIAIYPRWGYLPVSLGYTYYKMGDLDSAGIVWKKATIDLPDEVTPRNNLRALGGDYFNKAMAVGKGGNTDSAILMLQKAIALDSLNTKYRYNLGGIYYARKDYARARETWQQLLAIDPRNEDARKGIEAMRGL